MTYFSKMSGIFRAADGFAGPPAREDRIRSCGAPLEADDARAPLSTTKLSPFGLAAKIAIASERELVETLLCGTSPPGKAGDIAKSLLRRFRTLGAAVTAPERDLLAVPGVTESMVATLKAVQETMLRMLDRPGHYRLSHASWEHFLNWLTIRLGHELRTILLVVYFDKNNRLISDEEVDGDPLDGFKSCSRLIIRRALELGACSMVLVRNAPAGHPAKYPDPRASGVDLLVARHTASAAEPLGMSVDGLIIISPTGYVSYQQEELFSSASSSPDDASNNWD